MNSTIRTVPAILTDDPIALGKMVLQTESFTDFAQFDIMDGQFVPSTSVTCQDIAALGTKLAWEAHLMVLHPEKYLEQPWTSSRPNLPAPAHWLIMKMLSAPPTWVLQPRRPRQM